MKLLAIRRALTVLCGFAIVCSGTSSFGTMIDPMRWEQLVTSADFVGVVECVVAGGVVANYSVVDAWKGDAGDEIAIRVAVNYWEPQFPVVLCGERYLVAAYRSDAPSSRLTAAIESGVPLWWRQIPSEFRTPLFQGMIRLSDQTDRFFDSPHQDLASFKQAVVALVEMAPEEQEKLLLRVLSDKYLTRAGKELVADEDGYEVLKRLEDSISLAGSPSAILQVLLTAPKQAPRGFRESYVPTILRQAGGEATLRELEKLPAEDLPFDARTLESTMRAIRTRLGESGNGESKEASQEPRPSGEELRRLHVILADGEDARDVEKAFALLTVHDPGPVVEYLLSWEPKRGWRGAAQGYVLGSYFAWKCGESRERHLKALLRARDDYVRVAAATYLCFENEELGTQHLREFTKLDGDPGAWAALSLVRRGEQSAMPRALEVFSEMGEGGMAGVPHRNLQRRLLVLLSNSCRASSIPMPDILYGVREGSLPPSAFSPVIGRRQDQYVSPREALAHNQGWWERTKHEFHIHDPWLAELARQKID